MGFFFVRHFLGVEFVSNVYWSINNANDLLVHGGHTDEFQADFGHVLRVKKLHMKQYAGEQAEQKRVDRHASQPRQVGEFVNKL